MLGYLELGQCGASIVRPLTGLIAWIRFYIGCLMHMDTVHFRSLSSEYKRPGSGDKACKSWRD